MEGKIDEVEVRGDLIPYPEAKMILEERFPDTTDEEIAMWVFLEPPEDYDPNRDTDPAYPPGFEDYTINALVNGGFISYYRNDVDRAKAFRIYSRGIAGEAIEREEIRENLHLRYFSRRDIELFTPADRWTSFSSLMLRWSATLGEEDAAIFIDRKIDIERVLNIDDSLICGELAMGYPVVNVCKTKEKCMYSMSQIESIEKKEHLFDIGRAKTESNLVGSISLESVDRNKIMNAFLVKPDFDDNDKFWDEKLSDPPQWLIGAQVQVGKRGVSSRWNPLLTAHCLFERKYMSLRQLDSVIHKSFPELLDQWKDETEDLR
jgi:hypothetical protein